jgi:hypothetical protein
MDASFGAPAGADMYMGAQDEEPADVGAYSGSDSGAFSKY